MIRNNIISSQSYKAQRERALKRIAILESVLKDENRLPSILKACRQELAALRLDIVNLDAIISRNGHITRPIKTRKGSDWECICGAINVWHHDECKMILIEKQNVRQTKPRKQPRDVAAEMSLKSREPITETMPADFFDFLGD